MENLVEVRDSNGGAYEMRNGSRVEYAMTIDGQHKRMRALGCPEIVLVRAKRRLAARTENPTPTTTHKPQRSLTEAERDAERRRKAAAFGKTITAEKHADKQRQQAADAEQHRKDAELKDRMDRLAGRKRG